MKKLLLLVAIIFVSAQPVFAHPGNTSSDGCHFCKTNCGKWGYTYGTRHGHHGEVCNPSKGPIDPFYSNGGIVEIPTIKVNTPAITYVPSPASSPTPIIISTATPIPTLTIAPTITEIPTLTPTITNSPTINVTSTPEVKGVSVNISDRPKRSLIWRILAFLFGWK